MQEYIDHVSKGVTRPMTRESLLEWSDARPGLFSKLGDNGNEAVFVKEEWTGNEFEVDVTKVGPTSDEGGQYYFGILMKWGSRYQFMPSVMTVNEGLYQSYSKYVKQMYEESNADVSLQAFFANHFTRFLDEFLRFDIKGNPLDGWKGNEKERDVLRLLDEHIGEDAKRFEAYEHLNMMWMYYCDQHAPIIRKPEVFAAALEYFYRDAPYFGIRIERFTQKEIAKKYGVSANSISRRYDDLEDAFFAIVEDYGEPESSQTQAEPVMLRHTFPSWQVLGERGLYEMNARLSKQEFQSDEELYAFMQSKQNEEFVPETHSEKAQLTAYDGYEAETLEERDRLADAALELDPESVDARVLKASVITSGSEESDELVRLKKLSYLYEACNIAMREGLELEKGDLWNYVNARPFMRAQELLAATYRNGGDSERAIRLYEELLFYNVNDHQGIRHQVFPLYMETKDYQKAIDLLEKYEDDSVWWTFSNTLLMLEIEGETELVDITFKFGKRINPHVVPYLLGHATWEELPAYYEYGSEEEAIVYAWQNGHLWDKHHDFLAGSE